MHSSFRSGWQSFVFRAFVCAALAACSQGPKPPKGITPNTEGWWRNEVAYEIFVRSFADAGNVGVGNLQGISGKLDYLNDGKGGSNSLGIDTIWLMPIFPSPSYHGYDVTDYQSVNPDYGTMADLDALIGAAHQRHIQVLLDMVINHSSDQHPWFVDAETGPTAAHRDWYLWSSTDPRWQRPWGGDPWASLGSDFYYALFCPCMPDLNLRNSIVDEQVIGSMKFWLARGIDGFRLDAARYFIPSLQGDVADQPETHALIESMRASLQADFPNALLVAEVWTDEGTVATYYGAGNEVQLAFSFDLADAIKNALVAGDATKVINTLAVAESAFAGKDRGFEAPFLSNHDQARVMRALGADTLAMRVAAATLFALPGTPFVYYGEEIGMQGGAGSDDLNKRTTFHWDTSAPSFGFSTTTSWNSANELPGTDVATEQVDPGSLWNLYHRLIALRHAQPALAIGDASRPAFTGGGTGLLAVLRTAGSQKVLFVANYATAASGPFTVALSGNPAVLDEEGLTTAPASTTGQLSFAGLGPRSYAYVSL